MLNIVYAVFTKGIAIQSFMGPYLRVGVELSAVEG